MTDGNYNMNENNKSFGKYIESIRTSRGESLRKTAMSIGVSPQFYSEVEKDRRCAFVAERLKKLRDFLEMTPEEYQTMCSLAAKSYSRKNTVVPQDIADYIVERDYVISALRTMKELDADEEDWKKLTEDFIFKKRSMSKSDSCDSPAEQR